MGRGVAVGHLGHGVGVNVGRGVAVGSGVGESVEVCVGVGSGVKMGLGSGVLVEVEVEVEVGSGVAVATALAVEVGCTGIIVENSIATGTCFVDTTVATSLVVDGVSEQAIRKVIKVVIRTREINFLERIAKY